MDFGKYTTTAFTVNKHSAKFWQTSQPAVTFPETFTTFWETGRQHFSTVSVLKTYSGHRFLSVNLFCHGKHLKLETKIASACAKVHN